MNPLTILVTGSRALPDPRIVRTALGRIALALPDGQPLILRHGACPGPQSADQAAHEWAGFYADMLDIREDPMAADWDHCGPGCPSVPHRRVKAPGDIHHPGELDTYCPTAGPRRNAVMVAKAPRADRVVAFPHGASYGTRGCMRLAREAGIPVEVIR